MDDLNRLNDLLFTLKMSIKDRQLSTTDQLMLDILSEITDILSSDFREKQPDKKKKRYTSIPQKEIRNEKNVLSLREYLQTRRGPGGRD